MAHSGPSEAAATGPMPRLHEVPFKYLDSMWPNCPPAEAALPENIPVLSQARQTVFVLVRHAQSMWNKWWSEVADTDNHDSFDQPPLWDATLSPHGFDQIQATRNDLFRALGGRRPDLIICSPLSRTIMTAAELFDLPLYLDRPNATTLAAPHSPAWQAPHSAAPTLVQLQPLIREELRDTDDLGSPLPVLAARFDGLAPGLPGGAPVVFEHLTPDPVDWYLPPHLKANAAVCEQLAALRHQGAPLETIQAFLWAQVRAHGREALGDFMQRIREFLKLLASLNGRFRTVAVVAHANVLWYLTRIEAQLLPEMSAVDFHNCEARAFVLRERWADIPVEHLIATQPLLLLDGALATVLENRGWDLHDPLWSAKLLLQPAGWRALFQVHLDYLHAGAQIITTASYQASIEGFRRRGLTKTQAVNLLIFTVRLAVAARAHFFHAHYPAAPALPCIGSSLLALAAAAVGGQEALLPPLLPTRAPLPLIAGSIGPYGAFLADGSEYHGDYANNMSDRDLVEFHKPRLQAVIAGGCDIIAFETMPVLREVKLLLAILSSSAEPDMGCWVSFSCRDDGAHIADGTDFAACVKAVEGHHRVLAIGINCTAPRAIPSLLKIASACTSKPLIVYPNSGEHFDPLEKIWRPHATGPSPGDADSWFADQARAWRRSGARIIGGCCRTTPATIKMLSQHLASDSPVPP